MIPRIRTIKQEFFRHEGLFDLECETKLPIRVAFPGIWTCCDREGRFQWRPRLLKSMILPYDDCDFSRVLDALVTRGFIQKYRVGDDDYGLVVNWSKHQRPNNRESASTLPALGQEGLALQPNEQVDACATREPRDDDASTTKLKHARAKPHGNGNGKYKDQTPLTPLSKRGTGTKKIVTRKRDMLKLDQAIRAIVAEKPNAQAKEVIAEAALNLGFDAQYIDYRPPAGGCPFHGDSGATQGGTCWACAVSKTESECAPQ